MQEEKNENEQAGDIYSRWTDLSVFLYVQSEQVSDVEELDLK